jgi:hypothetical protein
MDGWSSGFGWKQNWTESRQHFIDWWNHKGLVVSTWGAHCKARTPHAVVPAEASRNTRDVPQHELPRFHCENVEWRAETAWRHFAQMDYGLDIVPIAGSCIGPGSLALALGCEPGFSPETVWFDPAWKDIADARDIPPIRFNPDARWWKIHEAQIRAHNRLANGAYLTSIPDLVENVDILSALRDPQTLMVDMLENPGWVEASVMDINRAWFEAFDRLHALAKGPDGGNAWCAFNIWGPGKTAKVQCDACSMYHLDGTQCVRHLDALLSIGALDAIQWTPQEGPGREPTWHERWHPLYKRVLDAGKSVQILGVPVEKMDYVLNAVGARGVFLGIACGGAAEMGRAARIADRWRGAR